MKEKFDVMGMTCSACSSHVEKAVSKVDGVREVQVNLLTNSMVVDYDEAKTNEAAIISAVEKGGYGAKKAGVKTVADQQPENLAEEEMKEKKHRFCWSLVFLIPLFYLSMGHMMGWPLPQIFTAEENMMVFGLTLLLLTIPILFLNRTYFIKGYESLFHLAPNMDSLIAVGSSAAFIYSVYSLFQAGYWLGHGDMAQAHTHIMDLYFESAGMILTLITLWKYFESRSNGRTSQAISRLLDLAPKMATVLRGDTPVEVPVEEVMV